VVPGFSNTTYIGEYDATYVVNNGDMLIGMDGEFNLARWRGGRALLNQRVCKVVPRVGKVEPQYLFWALPKELKVIEDRTPFVTVKHLSAKALETINLTMPSLSQQRRVADILDRADAIRRKRKDAIALIDELLRSAFLEMFGDPVTNPKGWPVKRLAELTHITTGNTPPRAVSDYYGEEIEWIKSDNINTPNHYLTRAKEGLSARGKSVGRIAPAGSSLMTCIAGSPDCIGNVALADREVAFNQQINALTPKTEIDHRFVYTLLLVGKRLVQAASTNSMKGMVSKGRLEEVQVPSPPSVLQRKFGVIFDTVLRSSRQAEAARAESECLFQTVVHRAFGESAC
jgi:type I restriction enzyme S subunit